MEIRGEIRLKQIRPAQHLGLSRYLWCLGPFYIVWVLLPFLCLPFCSPCFLIPCFIFLQSNEVWKPDTRMTYKRGWGESHAPGSCAVFGCNVSSLLHFTGLCLAALPSNMLLACELQGGWLLSENASTLRSTKSEMGEPCKVCTRRPGEKSGGFLLRERHPADD